MQTALPQAVTGQPTGFKKGMLSVIPNSVLEEQEKAEAQRRTDLRQSRPEIVGLAAHVRTSWQAAKQAKQPIEKRMIECARARKGEYDPMDLAEIQSTGGSEVYMMLVDEKCSGAASWIRDILMQPGEEPWGIDPTPMPDLPPEIAEDIAKQVQIEAMQMLQSDVEMYQQITGQQATHQDVEDRLRDIQPQIMERFKTLYDDNLRAITKEAKKRADRAEAKMRDIAVESNFKDALDEMIEDIVEQPAGFIYGPLVVRKKQLEWRQDETGKSHPHVAEKLVLTFRRISPFDVYPGPSATSIEDGDIIVRHRMSRKALSSMIGVKSFDDDAIRQVLDHYSSGMTNWLAMDNETTREQLEDRGQVVSDPSGKIDVLQYFGSVQGRMLIMHGVPTERIPDPFAEYDAEVWLCGSYVLKATLNADPLGRKPIYKASFRNVAGSFWGRGIPELIRDCQRTANATVRSMINNMGLASGPMVGVDVSAMDPGEDLTELHPWKIFQFNMENKPSGQAPLWFFQPNSNVGELMKTYEFFSNEADNKSGVPKYSYGTGKTQGAAGTSSGLAMLISNAARGIKGVIRNMDKGTIRPPVEALFDWVMLYQPDPALQGDCKIVARGSSALVAKEQQAVRRNEAMQIILNSPAVLNMIGPEGLAEFLRGFFQALDIGADEIVPRKEVIAAQNNKDMIIQQLSAQNQQLQQVLGGGQAPQGQPQQQLPMGRAVDDAGAVQGGMEANLFPGG
ncbi:hypothetical protein [Maridesulfovibrio sp.]|uniref:portal protein n=1 Tax=Maridesulfovibrio sp. TaxID=2795000 RepID=UPI0029CA68A1|nr:hypothetical protein [Maridesulfovibrio sp.]